MNLPNSSFEQAYGRLEKILELLNTGVVSLEESLKLYEEANFLLISCSKELQDAEKKIQILKKSRTGELQTDESNAPMVDAFSMNIENRPSETL
ncbi:MAG: exodeoxyribonuclease VII small subunit [Chlamydiales bacterium]